MRVTEFIHYLNRTDIGLGANVGEYDYTHIIIRIITKRLRYEYQKKLREINK